jgi:RND family efflux transporter MFP subunit
LAARSAVTSPLGGDLQRVVVQRGERVEAGQLLAEVVDPTRLDFAATAPAEVLSRLRRGQSAVVMTGGDTVPGTLVAVAPGVDSLTGIGEALIRITNRAGRLRPGQAATAVVTAGTVRNVLTVPETAIVLVGLATTVFVVGDDSLAHARPVELGIHAGGQVEVRGNLTAGDRVVTVGAYGLADGSKVVPVSAKPE